MSKRKKNKKPLTKKQKIRKIFVTVLILILAILLVIFAINILKNN